MTRVGWFGGSFNPPHTGHLILAEMTRSAMDLDEVMFIPAGNRPHKSVQGLAPARHRCRMVELAVQDNEAFTVSRWEVEREGPSYTLRTARELTKAMSADTELYLMLGADSVHDLP
ncbi:MAG: nicotinate (nicotinamide) nucleotide adenylyltransferase, partial [Planctomycetota bacterium]